MPFFVPQRLVAFEYFDDLETDLEYSKISEPYRFDLDFAFFAVNFGYSIADYEALTFRQKLFILKAWETKRVQDDMHLNGAVANAIANATRKKNKGPIPLWKKRGRTVDVESMQTGMQVVEEMEKEQGKMWVEKIYKANFQGGL